MIFLMSLAGESDAIKIYVVEKIGRNQKNYVNGIVSSCTQIGACLAAIFYHFSTELSHITYLWRANFIIGGIFGSLIIIMRNKFQESEEFLNYQKGHKFDKVNFWQLKNIINSVLKKFIIALLISGCIGGIYHFLIIFWGSFASKNALLTTTNQSQIINIISIIIYAIMSVISGFLADMFYPKKQIIVSLFLSVVVIIIIQFLLYLGVFLTYFPMILIAFAPLYVVPLHTIIQSIFTTNIRARMCGLSHSLGGMILSSTTPFFCMLLWQYYNSLQLVLGLLLLLLFILVILVIYLYNNILDSANKKGENFAQEI
jgi:MFS family permease